MNTQNKILKFEILAFYTSNQSHIKTPLDLLHLFASNSSLWNAEPSINSENCQIKDNCIEISIKLDTENLTANNISFSIIVQGKYEYLEPKRIPILKFLKEQQVETQSVAKDEVSKKMACELYSLIYEVENSLRAYITKFMSTKIGVNWWKTEAPQDFKKKVNDRKNNEKEFAPYIDNNLYLIDFDDLGEFIHKFSSGFITMENVNEKINNLEETPEAVRKIKEEKKSNYDKFFKETFKDKNFQEKWEELGKIRNKVAHNNLCTDNDLCVGQKIYEELIETIEIANQKLLGLSVSTKEVSSLQEEVNNLEEIVNHNPAHLSRYSERRSHRVTGIVPENLSDRLNQQLAQSAHLSRYSEQRHYQVTGIVPKNLSDRLNQQLAQSALSIPNILKQIEKITEINQPLELSVIKAMQKIVEQDEIRRLEVMKNFGQIVEQDEIRGLEVMKNFGQIAEQDKIRRDTLLSTTQPTVDIIQYLKKNGMF